MEDPGGAGAAKVDFFISYTAADQDVAVWIAWVLEAAGYQTVIQAWDFRPGREFITEMQQALVAARRVLAVLSPAYLGSAFARMEWKAALASDPAGTEGRLLPVRVAEVALQGLDLPRIYLDLVGLPRRRPSDAFSLGSRLSAQSPPLSLTILSGWTDRRPPRSLKAQPRMARSLTRSSCRTGTHGRVESRRPAIWGGISSGGRGC